MIFENMQKLAVKDTKLPKYLQLSEEMKSWISKKKIPAGTKLPNNRQLAKFFKVTPVTINRSLRKLAQNGIVDLKVGSGTYIASPNKKVNKTIRIGIICHDTPIQDNYYVSTVLSTFYSFWQNHKSDVITLVKNSKEYRKAIKEYSLDGIMVLDPQKEFESEISVLWNENYPIVSIGTKFSSPNGCSFGTDHEHAACEAVNFLAKLGHENIGAILPCKSCASSLKRLEGYKKGMWESKLPINPDWIVQKDPSLEEAIKELMTSSMKPTAFLLIAHSDIIPMYNVLNKLAINIPNDISLIAFDDPDYAVQLSPQLTVLSQPIKQFTQKAAESLINQITKENGGEFEEDLSYLIERESVVKI